ncbi:MAG: undecaprenyldiphospho-muramoylpentapeptide beta-N-acetylglucosaminyltransferase [Candidatus Kapabacteria bacterium]|nr:undecaprenyldiphospho-muramoylpentapeptide beta-N-acetylglucosaminyltransferase [Candidatus Kapabacteria bacterium]
MTVTAAPSNIFRVVVAAGGTGGHIFPAVAVVEQIEHLTNGNCSAVFMGSSDRMETVLIPRLGYPFVPMPIQGFRGLALSTLTLPLKVFKSIRIARDTIRAHRPHAVICTGAYVSYPVGIAAVREKVPLIVLESNLNPGKSNSRLASKASAMVLAFEESVNFYPANLTSRLHVLGNPVRSQIDTQREATNARLEFGLQPEKPTVLIFGGSLGAHTINMAVERSLPEIASRPWQVIWQTGKGFSTATQVPDNVKMVPFLEDMGRAYAAADLVFSRSGATTVAELGIVGKPAILCPLPSASTNEQQHNASVVAQNGGALVIEDATLRESLLPAIDNLMNDSSKRSSMSLSMKKMGKPNAARDAARLVLQVGGWLGGLQ